MKLLGEIVTKSVFADEPHFSDELLLPALAAGHNVTLVTAFVPSYLVRLVGDLASSPEIEPGKLTVIFCVPFNFGEKEVEARLLSRYLSLFASNSTEVKTFLSDAIHLVREGGLRFGALLSKEQQLLTPSCVGVIESGEPGSRELMSFVDLLAGDLNSPITVQGTWDLDSSQLQNCLKLVSSALNRVFPNLLRRSHDEVMSLIVEIYTKGYPRFDFPDSADIPKSIRRRTAANPSRARKTKNVVEDDDDEEELTYEDVVIEEGADYVDKILREVFIRESGLVGEDVTAFLGESFYAEIYDRTSSERQHTPPLHPDLLDVVGHGYATCWCGESFDREQGCPESLY